MKVETITSLTTIILTGALAVGLASAEKLKDPAERDEDISGTEVSVEVDVTADGVYRYTYRLAAPETNLGDVGGFELNISCDKALPEIGIDKPGYFRISSRDGRHVPAVVAWDSSEVHGPTRVNIRNQASWSYVDLAPGETREGMVIYSTAAPGTVHYKIEPIWNPFGYDTGDWTHDADPPEDWAVREDFIIHGIIEGPACPGDDEPRFAGSRFRGSPERINQLLTYSQPTRDRMRKPGGTEALEIVVHYHERLDAESFRVQPGWARRYFEPQPGGSQRVELPLRGGAATRIQLEGRAGHSDKPRDEDPWHHSFKDMDVFEVRIGEHPGQGRGGPDERPAEGDSGHGD